MKFEVEYNGGVHIAAAGLRALDIYEQEFGRDLIKDVYGVMEFTKADVTPDDEVLVTLDFRKVNWTALVRAAWACLKNEDDSIPPYKRWIAEASGLNLNELNTKAAPAFEDAFFPIRNGDAAKEAE